MRRADRIRRVVFLAAAAAAMAAPASPARDQSLPDRPAPRQVTDLGPGQAPVGGAAQAQNQCQDKGSIVELLAHRRSGVVSAWLGNGVRVHHMWMKATPHVTVATGPSARSAAQAAAATAPDRVVRLVITVTVPGGEALETDETRGLSRSATAAWRTPSARSVPGPRLRRMLSERGIEVTGLTRPDAIILRATVSGPAIDDDPAAVEDAAESQLDTALGAIRLLLTEPLVEPGALAALRAEPRGGGPAADADPSSKVFDAIMDRIMPLGDERFRMETPESDSAADPAAAQAWLDRLVTAAPIEVAIVGQVRLDDATTLAARHLGALPDRPRISTATLRQARFAVSEAQVAGEQGMAGPIEVDEPIDPATTAVCVAAGFLGPREVDLRTQRALTMAAYAVRDRIGTQAGVWAGGKKREGRGGGGGREVAWAWAVPGGAYPPGVGMFVSMMVVPPLDVGRAQRELAGAIAALAEAEIEPDLFEHLREQYLERLRLVTAGPEYWSEVLASATYRGYQPDELTAAEEMVRSFTPAQIRDVWRTYATPERSIRVVVPAN